MTTERYPFSTDEYHKGDIVPTEVIERGYSVTRGTKEFQFALMSGRDFVAMSLAERGEFSTVVIEGECLHVLTDAEQVEYNSKQFAMGIRKARRSHRRMIGADRSQIGDPELLAKHDRTIEVHGRQLAAILRESVALSPPPTPRLTPGKK